MADARSIHAEFLRRRAAGEPVDFEQLCAEHKHLALALRALHSLALDEEGAARSDETTVAPREARASAGSAPGAQGGRAGSGAIESPPDSLGARVAALGGASPGGELQAGQSVGPYLLVEKIGEGGFATVFRAEQSEPVRRVVALKSIKPELVTRDVLARFAAERQALAMMAHPSIAAVHDAGTTEDGRPYVVMEYVDGVPITEFADRVRLDLRARLELFLQVVDAVQHAHQKAIVHRDLKPSNVLVTEESGHAIAKVIDFGIAKAIAGPLTEDTLVTGIGQIIGTPEYMSPEQVEARDGGVDTRTDIYALGVILHELLAGVRPFDSAALRKESLSTILRRIAEDERPRASVRLAAQAPSVAATIAAARRTEPRALLRVLRADLDWVLSRALERDPARRYATAREFGEDLGRYLRHEPLRAGPPSFGYRLRKLVRRRRVPIAASVAVLATALVVGLSVRSSLASAKRERAAGLLRSGESEASLAEAKGVEIALARERFRQTVAAIESWAPVWERGEELRLRDEIAASERIASAHMGEAFVYLSSALELAPPDDPLATIVRAEMERLYFRSRSSVDVPLRGLLFRQVFGEDASRARATEPGLLRLALRSDPPGARVRLFRYELVEERLLPLPFGRAAAAADGELRVVGAPLLRIDAIHDAARARAFRAADGTALEFRPGDIWREVEGVALRTRGDLARAIASVPTDAELSLTILRAGEELALRWTPRCLPHPSAGGDAKARDAAGRLWSIPIQLGLSFEGYPLAPGTAGELGFTSRDAPLEIELPSGSYLVVLEKEGHLPARLPVALPSRVPLEETVQLVETAPPGFVHVPAGRTRFGGDEDAEQPLAESEERVDGFFMARCEVTFGEYLAFLEAIRERCDASDELVGLRLDGVALEPLNNSKSGEVSFIRRDESGALGLVERIESPRWPVLGVSFRAAEAYARWRTETDPDGWVYRLATDLEWERAARGADGRRFVWGDYLVWHFAWSFFGNPRALRLPGDVGSTSSDESVFGVRDLAGSAEELTSGAPLPGFVSRRGGSWERPDASFFRAATRNGLVPEVRTRQVGVRLVAELERRPRP